MIKISKQLIKRLHCLYRERGLTDDEKKHMISELTNGRTTSTADLSANEGIYLAGFLSGASTTTVKQKSESIIRLQRSAVLKRLQQIGIDTSNWKAVNSYLSDKRIAGKVLYEMTGDELAALIPKLESIKRKKNGL